MANHFTVTTTPGNFVKLTPNAPFVSADLTQDQTCELIVALQRALDHIRERPFTSRVSIESWNAV